MQGISVYERPGRSCWYVAYDSPESGRRVNESSGFRLDDPKGKVKAYAYARDQSASGIAHGAVVSHERWDSWAEEWLKVRFADNAKTLAGYLGAWKQIALYFRETKLHLPRQLMYENVVGFVHWRESQVKKTSGKKVSRNTALHNVYVLSRVMREAVRRGYAQGNPCVRLQDEVPPAPVLEKPEYTDGDIAKVRAELERRAAIGRKGSGWMPIAFEIALAQGCRLSATQIPMHKIDFKHWTIRFAEKGGQDFTVPVNPTIRPLLAKLRDEGRKFTCELPRFASRSFSRVLRDAGLTAPPGMAHHTFHSTRVTVISRGARAGVSQQKMMKMVNHANWSVQKTYTRLQPADVAEAYPKLDLPAPDLSSVSFSDEPEPACDSPQSRDARRARH